MVPGDTLWRVATRFLGTGTRWPAIYDANKSMIEKAAKNHGLASSDHGHWIFPGTRIHVGPGGLLNTLRGRPQPLPNPEVGRPVTHPADCSKGAFLIAARGSGETNNEGQQDLGGTAKKPSALTLLFNDLNSPVGSTGVYGVPYAAVDALTFLSDTGPSRHRRVPDSTQFGAIQLAAAVRAQAECPNHQKIFLAGYSQGALVVREALALLPPDVRSRISGIALFGDPIVPRRLGPEVPADLAGRTTSQCADGDPVCDPSLSEVSRGAALALCGVGGLAGRFTRCRHFSYSGGAADLAAAFLRARGQ
ncbi:cutinase family protein [Streptomyces rapamycinicus]|uniref:Cutinase family protein n=2 Tax=Streptomyces rhizosphaericus TaxID=114699 RepID=A0A6G4ACI3_9ACTN|nr:cutinase family protein [Streptomyces rhizosphaericus]